MKKSFLKIIPTLALILLSAKILNWIFNFSDATNGIINTLMFTLIGVSYLFLSFNLENKVHRNVLAVCGLFLIVMNFLPDNSYLTIVGIFSIVVPMFIGRFSKEYNKILNN